MAKKKPRKKPPPPKQAPPRQGKRYLKLMVIPEPEEGTRTVFVYAGEGTVMMRGDGNVVMECGNCGAPLIEGVPTGNIRAIVFRCKNCGAFNDTLA